MENPKAFISYSWSNPDHEAWVLKLAAELVESGVDVKLDKWHLREGHDAIQFMESMVADPSITKVIIVSDKIYSQKSDTRTAGVGTEAQIISPEIYANTTQSKFVVVVAEKDESGKAYLPTYYKSRIYIDLSNSDNYAQNFEQLLRWVYDKPVYVRPELGSRPAFLDDREHTKLGTTAAYNRATEALRGGKPFAAGAIDEYFNIFANNLERFRMVKTEAEPDEVLIENIGDFIPYRNEFIQMCFAISKYLASEDVARKLHAFFEKALSYSYKTPEGVHSYSDSDWDNYKFVTHELFMYATTIFIEAGEFHFVNNLLSMPYYLRNYRNSGREAMANFDVFYDFVSLLRYRNQRMKLRRLDLHSDLLKERNAGTGIEFRHLMQVDFILFIRSHLVLNVDLNECWFPVTLLYSANTHWPFEMFSRSMSKSYFDRIKILLGIDSPADLKPVMERFRESPRLVPTWEHSRINVQILLNFDKLATMP